MDATGGVATITASKNLECGLYDAIRVRRQAMTGETDVSLTLTLAGTTSGGVPDPAEPSLGVTGPTAGSLRIIPSVGATRYPNNPIAIKQLLVVPGKTAFPTAPDPARPHKYIDTHGNGEPDFADVVLYFREMNFIEDNQPVYRFDFNENGYIDFVDVIVHFRMV